MKVMAIQTFACLICALATIAAGGPFANRPILPRATDPTGCCTFDTDVCGFTSPSNQWYWSSTLLPVTPVPTHDGNYIWSDIPGSSLLSGHITEFTPSTPFTMDYYISAPGVAVDLYFNRDAPAGSVLVGRLTYSPGIWSSNPRTCTECCGDNPICEGYFEIRIAPTNPPFVMAVDTTQIGGSCHDAFPCCYFKDSHMCDFTILPAPISWNWFPDSDPKNFVPSSVAIDGYFMFLETVSYTGPAFSATIRSPVVAVSSTTEFQGYFYVHTPTASVDTDTLDCYFHDLATGIRTRMDSVKHTDGQWVYMYFFCVSANGDCCQGAPTCNGYIEFEANVDSAGGSMDFAIEAFQIGYSCAPFPGSGNKSSYIPLLPVH